MKFPLEEVAKNRERADALMAHLSEHWSYYRFALFQALPPSEQLDRLITGSSNVLRAGMFEPRVVSAHGDQLAVPLNTSNYPGLEAFLLNMLGDVKETEPSTSTVLLPTPGMSIESRLGRCTGCEDYIERTRAIELRRLSAVADQAEHEAARLKAQARCDAAPARPQRDPARSPPRRTQQDGTEHVSLQRWANDSVGLRTRGADDVVEHRRDPVGPGRSMHRHSENRAPELRLIRRGTASLVGYPKAVAVSRPRPLAVSTSLTVGRANGAAPG